ncbi:hypothetical protein RSK20926_22089 [Roseobacter sp. SK209-2-6]|nr:hypothetical protein RSK20926_22089 [Roseobacter sp. SK209-2-6]
MVVLNGKFVAQDGYAGPCCRTQKLSEFSLSHCVQATRSTLAIPGSLTRFMRALGMWILAVWVAFEASLGRGIANAIDILLGGEYAWPTCKDDGQERELFSYKTAAISAGA